MIDKLTLEDVGQEVLGMIWREKQKERDELVEMIGASWVKEEEEGLEAVKKRYFVFCKQDELKRLDSDLWSLSAVLGYNERAGDIEQRIQNAKNVSLLVLFGVDSWKKPLCCPIHQDKSPSLRLYEKTNTWHCFGCHQGRDSIDLLVLRDGLSFMEAVQQLCPTVS